MTRFLAIFLAIVLSGCEAIRVIDYYNQCGYEAYQCREEKAK